MTDITQILTDLIGFPSITPEDAGCQKYMIQFLEQLGFTCQQLNNGPVSNFLPAMAKLGLYWCSQAILM